jgi:hypothetical protein
MILRSLLVALLLAAPAVRAQSQSQVAPATALDEQPHRGTYVETSLGIFTAFGGSAGASNVQPFLSLSLGREIGESVTMFLSLGISGVSASCFASEVGVSQCPTAPDSFGMTFIEVGASFGFSLAPRTLLSLKVVSGGTDISPGPLLNTTPSNPYPGCLSAASPCAAPDSLFGYHFGGGLSLDYDTRLPHFGIGVDLLVRYTVASYSSQTLGITSASLLPRIRYVF